MDTPPPPVVIIMQNFPEPAPTALNFWYNPLHDMESFIWIVLYFVVKRGLVIHDNFDPAKQNELAALLFFSDSAQRRNFLLDVRAYHLNDLHPSVHVVVMALSQWIDKLVTEHREAEKDVSAITHQVASGLYTVIHQNIRTILQTKQLLSVEILPVRKIVEKRDGDAKESCDVQIGTTSTGSEKRRLEGVEAAVQESSKKPKWSM